MEELQRLTGGPWGSDEIDRLFDSLLDEIFGKRTMNTVRKTVAYNNVINAFRKSKMQFWNNPCARRHKVQLNTDFIEEVGSDRDPWANVKGVDDAEIFRDILESAAPFGLSKGHITLEEDTMWMSKEIWTTHLFDRIIDPIVGHVQDLIAEVNEVPRKDGMVNEVNLLCFVGGLSSSKYFQHRIIDAFGTESEYNLLIRWARRPVFSVIDGVYIFITQFCNSSECESVSVSMYTFPLSECTVFCVHFPGALKLGLKLQQQKAQVFTMYKCSTFI